MLTQSLSNLFTRDIQKIKTEVEAYSSDEAIWLTADGISNSAGNLSLHLSGNLQHFIGAMLGGTDYKRDREFEFNGKVSRHELLDDLDAALISVTDTLASLSDDDVQKTYPMEFYGKAITTEWFLMHLFGHLSYHLGQINYHRRLLDK